VAVAVGVGVPTAAGFPDAHPAASTSRALSTASPLTPPTVAAKCRLPDTSPTDATERRGNNPGIPAAR
jgi:hypothetical protein